MKDLNSRNGSISGPALPSCKNFLIIARDRRYLLCITLMKEIRSTQAGL